ncbi:hypothetical protein [Paenibacillus wulumuqiensis]|uniref:hypothetical protein n=1 Tax=Paenibacillus wulumuqiensis TaxID=1567107 RepID=UPI00061A05FA|nr:hypothetical protein [Paenibacillus wulumuqiensis]
MKFKSRYLQTGLIAVLVLSGLTAAQPSVHAGWWEDYKNGVKSFTSLPEEVNELKQGYSNAMNQLDQAQTSIEAYREENARLAEQNQLLAQTIQQLQQSEAERAASARFWKTIVFSAIGLVVLWFVFTRLVRFGLRRR